jgi:hypothetical protein
MKDPTDKNEYAAHFPNRSFLLFLLHAPFAYVIIGTPAP